MGWCRSAESEAEVVAEEEEREESWYEAKERTWSM